MKYLIPFFMLISACGGSSNPFQPVADDGLIDPVVSAPIADDPVIVEPAPESPASPVTTPAPTPEPITPPATVVVPEPQSEPVTQPITQEQPEMEEDPPVILDPASGNQVSLERSSFQVGDFANGARWICAHAQWGQVGEFWSYFSGGAVGADHYANGFASTYSDADGNPTISGSGIEWSINDEGVYFGALEQLSGVEWVEMIGPERFNIWPDSYTRFECFVREIT